MCVLTINYNVMNFGVAPFFVRRKIAYISLPVCLDRKYLSRRPGLSDIFIYKKPLEDNGA